METLLDIPEKKNEGWIEDSTRFGGTKHKVIIVPQ